MAEEVAKKIRYVTQNYFENANKPVRWLAYKLRKESEKSLIHSLRNEDRTEKHGQEDLKGIVDNFYKKLYQVREIHLDKQAIFEDS